VKAVRFISIPGHYFSSIESLMLLKNLIVVNFFCIFAVSLNLYSVIPESRDNESLLDPGSRPPQADSSGMTVRDILEDFKNILKNS